LSYLNGLLLKGGHNLGGEEVHLLQQRVVVGVHKPEVEVGGASIDELLHRCFHISRGSDDGGGEAGARWNSVLGNYWGNKWQLLLEK